MTDNSAPPRATRRQVLGMAGLAAAAPILGAGPIAPASASAARTAASAPIAESGAWCWFGDPRAIHVDGRTYVSYITRAGEIACSVYDHADGQLSTSVLQTGFQIDDHNNPSIVRRPDGHLVVFWTEHGHNDAPIYYRRSVAPDDASDWEPRKEMRQNTSGRYGWTYPNLAQLSEEPNKLYMFFRAANWDAAFTSTSGADVWAPAQSLVTNPGERPYLKQHSNGVGRIHFAFTEGHPRNVHTSVYYMCYDAADQNLHRADGSVIGPLGTPVRAEEADVVYDADGAPKAWVWDVAEDADGNPVVVYANFPSDSDHRYRYARWNSGGWQDVEMTSAGDRIPSDPSEPLYSGGLSLDHADPSTVVLSRQHDGGFHRIERWRTPDGGQTWTSEVITPEPTELNARPVIPHGLTGGGAMSVLWMAGSYTHYTDYETRIMALTG
ncbi:MAG: BNR-4 repeat-containing protein [Stackebrandtia sp.]